MTDCNPTYLWVPTEIMHTWINWQFDEKWAFHLLSRTPCSPLQVNQITINYQRKKWHFRVGKLGRYHFNPMIKINLIKSAPSWNRFHQGGCDVKATAWLLRYSWQIHGTRIESRENLRQPTAETHATKQMVWIPQNVQDHESQGMMWNSSRFNELQGHNNEMCVQSWGKTSCRTKTFWGQLDRTWIGSEDWMVAQHEWHFPHLRSALWFHGRESLFTGNTSRSVRSNGASHWQHILQQLRGENVSIRCTGNFFIWKECIEIKK